MSFHALHLLLQLGRQPGDTPLSASELAAACGISEHFIQKIMRLLQGQGIVRSIRGIAGGHMLARNPDEISLADIIVAVEGGLTLPTVKSDHKSDMVMEVWSTVCDTILRELRTVSLAAMLERHAKLTARRRHINRADSGIAHRPVSSLGRIRCRRRPKRSCPPTAVSGK